MHSLINYLNNYFKLPLILHYIVLFPNPLDIKNKTLQLKVEIRIYFFEFPNLKPNKIKIIYKKIK